MVIGLFGACTAGQPEPSSTPTPLPGLQSESVAHGRFTVLYWDDAIAYARSAQRDLKSIVDSSLTHIDHLLPGPRATIVIHLCDAPIPMTGTCGVTAATGLVSEVGFAPTPGLNVRQVLDIWLPRTLAHEVHHEVRAQASPGHPTLLAGLVQEGTADLFDNQAFPGVSNPWDAAITPSQEHALWAQAQSELDSSDLALYNDWLFGNGPMGIPHWAGFTIGYHIAAEYLSHNPSTTASSLAKLSAKTILAGSDYSP